MRTFKILIIVSCMFLVCATLSFAQPFKPGSEPDGFRGIKWETALSSLSGMKYSHTDEDYKVYLRTGDELIIGGAKLNRIEYYFRKGKFVTIFILTEGLSNFQGLKAVTFEKFGKGFQANEYIERYVWVGGQTAMMLEYNEMSEKGRLYMSSQKMNKQRKAEDRQKAKEGAKKGF